MIRVSAGKFKNRVLEAPKDNSTVPTMGKTKEAIFSALSTRVNGANVLDLFAGSGSLGIEALSRGAKRATFVDLSPAAIKTINENLKKVGFAGDFAVFKSDTTRYLSTENSQFDIILMDPPYDDPTLIHKALDLILKRNLLTNDGIIVVESKQPLDYPGFQEFEKVKTYHHGIANILIAWKKV